MSEDRRDRNEERGYGSEGHERRVPSYHEANSTRDYRAYREYQRNRRYQVKRPTQGTWYEHEAERPTRSGARNSSGRIDIEEEERVHLQRERRERYNAERSRRSQTSNYRRKTAPSRGNRISAGAPSDYERRQLERHAPTSANYTSRPTVSEEVSAKMAEKSPFAPDDPRLVYIRIAIVAVLIVLLLARAIAFGTGTGAELASVNGQIDSAQAQLTSLNDSNSQMEAQQSAWQTTIDAYNKVASSSSS